MGFFKKLLSQTASATQVSAPATVEISGDLRFPTVAVGEDYTKDAIIDLVTKHATAQDLGSGKLIIEGVVRPEPTNAYDPDALVVLIGGVKVGYVSADRTSSFRRGVLRILEEKSGARLSPQSDWIAEFTMRIGWKPDEKYPRYGVAIDTPAGFYNP